MSQMKWVFIMVMIVIVALGVLVVLLLFDGANLPAAAPTPSPAVSSAAAPPEATQAPEQPQPTQAPTVASYVYPVYDDAPVHYGDIAYMGSQNNGDDGSMTIDPACADNPHSGDSCIRITYDAPFASQWAGMMWLSGANNYPPNLPVDGVDAAQANRLTFYVRGAGTVKFFIENDKKQQVTQNVQLASDWTQYTLDVPADWEHVCVGFGFATNSAAGSATIYLDDIAYSN